MQNDLISRSALKETMFQNEPVEQFHPMENKEWCKHFQFIENAPAVDAVEVVRCKDCKHGIWNEDEGLYQCIEGADYDPELFMYLGFVIYEEADFFCKRGERRTNE